jgi:hypothetical protein
MWHRKKSAADDPIAIAQEALAKGQAVPGKSLVDSINHIVTDALWKKGTSYSDFGQFAIAPVSEGGLGVRSTLPARLLKFALMEGGHIREWTSVLLVIKRPPGHPGTGNNDEGFRPFYKVNTSMNSQDRALITLGENHPQVFEDVCQRKCSVSAGAIKAGLKPTSPPRWQFGLEVIFGMHADAQVDLMREVFNGFDTETQAAFIEGAFEGVLGTGLAQKWREARSHDAKPEIS